MPVAAAPMDVIKRDGSTVPLDRDGLRTHINNLAQMKPAVDTKWVDVDQLADTVVQGCYSGIPTAQIDELAAQTSAYLATNHPDYALLAGRIATAALHRSTPKKFSECVEILYHHVNARNGQTAPLISEDVYKVATANKDRLDAAIRDDRDFTFEFFGYKTLERSYLLRESKEQKIVERTQYMLMRVAIGIWSSNIDKVLATYDLMCEGWFTHATPTLFNAGTPKPQLSSCFLVAMKDDSIDGIYDTLKQCALISKSAGGIGIHTHNIRATGSYIRGTNGQSNGLVPMIRVFNDTARYVDQGGGRRKGAFAVYLEPWHADILDFLALKKNTGKEEARARDLFFGLWVPDLFMKRVEENGHWSLFCPNEAPGLADVWGEEFEKLYTKYEGEGRAKRKIKAQEVWFAVLESQIETGTPYMLYKDACNGKSNQQNLGTIKCSNLCTEIVEYTSPEQTAVCNLASIALPKYVVGTGADAYFDHDKLRDVTKQVTRNLNQIIDVNYYPVESAQRSNFLHRPIGIGVQGLADTFIKLGYPFTSEAAQRLNEEVFETIYYSAMEASCDAAEVDGPYSTFQGSPASQGKFQFDLWGVKPRSKRWDWDAMRTRVMKTGMRNSLLLAPMPTASTSQILGNNECFEPFTSNIYVRRVLSGEFPVVNKYLVKDLISKGLWSNNMKDLIIANNGSVQSIPTIPAPIKELYCTVWEVKQKIIIDMAAARAAYIDQSQSLNLFLPSPTLAQLTSMHFYGWKKGLKTGMYYLRTRPVADAIKFTVDQKMLDAVKSAKSDAEAAKDMQTDPTPNPEGTGPPECEACGS